DQGWEELGDAGEHWCDQQADQRGGYHRAEHYWKTAGAVVADDGDHGRHAGEGYALYQRQLTAEERQAEGLQQGSRTSCEQRGGDQQADFRSGQTGCLTDDQW